MVPDDDLLQEVVRPLCAALAAFARCICIEDVVPEHLAAFTAARLIPLDKRPGVRPIAVGETFRRIVGRAIMKVVERDILLATAPSQLCVGVPSSCEAGVHAMQQLYSDEQVEGILFVDASNAFNALNRRAALHNVPRVCPALGKVFKNTYGRPIRLFVTGGGEITSQEGTCQGDPLAMALYAVATVPLIQRLQESHDQVRQAWYADDDAAGGSITCLADYWDDIQRIGPGYGYYPNPKKTVLLVKPEFEATAQRLFSSSGVIIKTDGNRHLGGVIGSPDFATTFLTNQAKGWKRDLSTLAKMACTQPQAAYTVLTKGLSSRWTYHLRCSLLPEELCAMMDAVIDEEVIPALMGKGFPVDSPERELLSFPARCGGLAIPVLRNLAQGEFDSSVAVTEPLVQLLLTGTYKSRVSSDPQIPNPLPSQPESRPSDVDGTRLSPPSQPASQPSDEDATGLTPPLEPVRAAIADVRSGAREVKAGKLANITLRQRQLRDQLSDGQKFLLEIAAEKGVSSWLTVLPSWREGTVLSKSDFRDALCIRYDQLLPGLPETCVCSHPMSTAHAFTCPTGGYTIARHNDVRDLIAECIRDAGVVDVEVEPKLLPCDGSSLPGGRSLNRADDARLDVRARGFWSRQQDAFFDVRVTHPAASVLSRSEALSQLRSHERRKKNEYGSRVINVERGTFTPLVFSTYGISGPETTIFLKSLASLFVERNADLSYSVVMGILRTRISFCLLKWCITCFRGCRNTYVRRRFHSVVTQCRMAQ